MSHSRENDFDVTEWKSDVPLAVAGFNYGEFKKKERTDEQTKYDVEAYATSEVPDYLHAAAQRMKDVEADDEEDEPDEDHHHQLLYEERIEERPVV